MQNVLSRVDVRIVGVPALDALKLGLCLTILFACESTRRAGLASVCCVNSHHLTAALVRFGFQPSAEHIKAAVENRAIES